MRDTFYLHTNVNFTYPSIGEEQEVEPTPQTQIIHLHEFTSYAEVFAYAELLLAHGFINSYHIQATPIRYVE